MYHDILLVGSDAGRQKILRMNVAILLKPINRMFRNKMSFCAPKRWAMLFLIR